MKRLTAVLALVVLAGCKTYVTDTYERTFYKEDGKTINYVEKGIMSKEQSPFVNKAVRAEGAFMGGEITMTDPQTGNPMPSFKFLNGNASAGAIPVTSGTNTVVETFGTYREVFRYEKSAWPWSTSVASMSYDRVAGGAGVKATPSITAAITMPASGEAAPTVAVTEAKPPPTPTPEAAK